MDFTKRPKSRRSGDYKPAVQEKPKKAAKTDEVEDDGFSPRQKKPPFFTRVIHAIFPCKGDGAAESIRKIVFDVAVVALVITGGSVLYDVITQTVQTNISDKVIENIYISGSVDLDDAQKQEILKEKPQIMEQMMGVYAANKDTVGCIQLGSGENVIVSLPVMQAADNDYYLTHNFNREEIKSGAVFADYRNVFEPGKLSGNTILYGHNVWDGSMFAKLTRYYDATIHGDYPDRLGFYKDHPTITFNTLYEASEWKVFAAVLFNTREDLGEVYPYTSVMEFGGKDEFNSFILDVMDRSILWTDVDLDYGDSILTLSTCYMYGVYSESTQTRCVVFARKVRPGESSEVDVTKAQTNPTPLKFTYQYQQEGGERWTGRTWDTSKLLSYSR